MQEEQNKNIQPGVGQPNINIKISYRKILVVDIVYMISQLTHKILRKTPNSCKIF